LTVLTSEKCSIVDIFLLNYLCFYTTAILLSSKNGFSSVVRVLFAEGAKIEIKDNDGFDARTISHDDVYDTISSLQFPLIFAAKHGRVMIFEREINSLDLEILNFIVCRIQEFLNY
jgi:ankyrin repeat protein